MSFFRKHVRDLLRQTFSKNGSTEGDSNSDDNAEQFKEPQHEVYVDSSVIYERYLNGRSRRKVMVPEIYSGKTGLDLPVIQLDHFDRTHRAAFTGPDGGLLNVQQMRQQRICKMANMDDEFSLSNCSDDDENDNLLINNRSLSAFKKENGTCGGSLESLGFCSDDLQPGSSTDKIDWDDPCEERAFGVSVSLYERHPISGVQAGTPIADVFGVWARKNHVIMALADGVNWGEGARLAARCAIRGALDHINHAIEEGNLKTTNEVFHSLLGAFHTAHALILQEGGALTTLCVTVVAPVRNSNSYVLCVCNVGDSLCFVQNPIYGVREVTLASHEAEQHRNMRDAGGALGPVDGRNPQLHNLTCSMTFVEEGDFVFITSDGVSDNFDPVVGKFCLIKRDETEKENEKEEDIPAAKMHKSKSAPSNGLRNKQRCLAVLPCVSAADRQELMLLRMADVIVNGIGNLKESFAGVDDAVADLEPERPTASSLCHNLVNFAYNLSAAKRRTLEDPDLYRTRTHSKTEERLRRKMIRNMIMEMPGKLDHASVVAYKVGMWSERRSKPHKQSDCSAAHSNGVNSNPPTAKVSVATPLKEKAAINTQITCMVRMNKPAVTASSTTKIEHAASKLVLHLDIPPELQHDDPPIHRARCKSPYEEMPIRDSAITPHTPAKLREGQRKHGRGSTLRHTLGVDVTWLKRLVINRHFTPGTVEETTSHKPSGSTDAMDGVEDTTLSAATPLDNRPTLASSSASSSPKHQLYTATTAPKALHHSISQGIRPPVPNRLHTTQSTTSSSQFSLRRLKKFVKAERNARFSAKNDTFL